MASTEPAGAPASSATPPTLRHDWHPVGFVRDFDRINPVAARVLGEDMVVWRGLDGAFHAWRDLCVHRGTKLSLGRITAAGCLECPYHGWTYDASGQCTLIPAHPDQKPPAKAAAVAYSATTAYGLVWVALGRPARGAPDFPEAADPSYRKILCGPYPVEASAPRIVENFLDVAHFAFVHEGILGVRARPEIADYEVETDGDGAVARNIQVYQPDPYGTGVGDTVTYTYRVQTPYCAYLIKNAQQSLAILLAITPHEPGRSTAYMVMAMNYAHDAHETELAAFQDRIFAQDKPVLESQRPELLPLDLQAELHLRCDRMAIAYRQWLARSGITFGTA